MDRRSALVLSLMLICQIMANGLNTTLMESESENFLNVEDIFQSAGNNSSGNNTGGNNTGGNNTGGNNTGGNNTGGNNTYFEFIQYGSSGPSEANAVLSFN